MRDRVKESFAWWAIGGLSSHRHSQMEGEQGRATISIRLASGRSGEWTQGPLSFPRPILPPGLILRANRLPAIPAETPQARMSYYRCVLPQAIAPSGLSSNTNNSLHNGNTDKNQTPRSCRDYSNHEIGPRLCLPGGSINFGNLDPGKRNRHSPSWGQGSGSCQ